MHSLKSCFMEIKYLRVIKTLLRICKDFVEYITLIFCNHYKIMKCVYIVNIYISIYISPKQ